MEEGKREAAKQAARARTEFRIASQTAAAANGAQVLMTVDVVAAAIGQSRGSIYSMIRAGQFPAPVRFGARCSRWPSKTVADWIAARIAAS